jgi:hypothetical protein
MGHLTISVKSRWAMVVNRVSTNHDKLVYVITTDKPLRYKKGSSHIAYIGETRSGVERIATSLASKADTLLTQWGVRHLVVRVVTCRPLQRVKTWKKLETALLLCFRDRHGQWPLLNKRVKQLPSDEFAYFRKPRVKTVLRELEVMKAA